MSLVWPHVTVCTLTHARTSLLQNCMTSVRRLRYPGAFDHLILNDCPEQTLVCHMPGVRVVNHGQVLRLGDKRNMALAEAQGDWVAWVDDDDSLLPHHLMKIEHAVSANADYLRSVQTLYFCGENGEVTGAACMDSLMRREAAMALGFPSIDVGEDWAFFRSADNSGKVINDPTGDPTYVQAWCNGSYHITGQGDRPDAQSRFRQDALRRIAAGEEPSGTIRLIPRCTTPHARLAPAVVAAWKARKLASRNP